LFIWKKSITTTETPYTAPLSLHPRLLQCYNWVQLRLSQQPHCKLVSAPLYQPPLANGEPPSKQSIPPAPLWTQHDYVFLGGDFPLFGDDWVIAILELDVLPQHHGIIGEHLQGGGI
jgi:hypothetical protein